MNNPFYYCAGVLIFGLLTLDGARFLGRRLKVWRNRNRYYCFAVLLFLVNCNAPVPVNTVSSNPELERYDVHLEEDHNLAFQIPEYIPGDIPLVQVYVTTRGAGPVPTTVHQIDFRITEGGVVLASVGAWNDVIILIAR